MKKILSFSDLSNLRSKFLSKKIVYLHGVFDLLHYGHLLHIREARSLGDILIVSVTADKFVNKGPLRPLFAEIKRLEMLAELELVDFVFISDAETAVPNINELKPDIYVKGPDYKNRSGDITGGITEEESAVVRNGGVIFFTTSDTYSSSEIINSEFNNFSKEQKHFLSELKQKYTANDLCAILDSISGLKVCVVGEPIIDKYVECKVEGISSKSPNLSARKISSENHLGGALAAAKHARNLGAEVDCLIPLGYDEIALSANTQFKKQYQINNLIKPHQDIKTPTKTRYITAGKNQKLFEITDIHESCYSEEFSNKFEELIKKFGKYDIVLGLDFGHGLWTKEINKHICEISKFFSLNVQTNSSNFGYNLINEAHCYDLTILDERELRLATQNRHGSINEAISLAVNKKIIRPPFSVTKGASGSIFIDKNFQTLSCPVFSKTPIDTIGSGDAFFVIFSILKYLNAPPLISLFLGNLLAGMQANFVGNKGDIEVFYLKKAIRALFA